MRSEGELDISDMERRPMTEPMDPPFDTVPPSPMRATWQSRKVIRLRPRRQGPRTFRTDGVDPNDMLGAVARTGARYLALIRSLPPEAADVPVPGLTWTVAETVAHQYTVVRRGRDPRRAQTLEELGRLNQICVDEVPSRDLQELAALIETEVSLSGRLLRRLPALWRMRVGRWLMFKLHLGIEADLPVTLSYGVVDMLLHGWEIARATDAEWTIPPADAAVALVAGLPQLCAWTRPDIIEGEERSHTITFGHELPAVTVTVGNGRHDVRYEPATAANAVAVDPVAFLLHVFGRTGPTGDPVIDDVASWTLPV